MLVVPLKTSHRTDLGYPLAYWIDAHGTPNSAPYREDLLRLSALRNCVTSAVVSSTSHARAMSHNVPKDLKEYHASLLLCECLGLGTGKRGKIDGLHVFWENAFVTTVDASRHQPSEQQPQQQQQQKRRNGQSNLRYERTCVLFNAAAMESFAAKEALESSAIVTDEAYRTAAAKYKAAAGMFQEVHSLLHNHENTTTNDNNDDDADDDLKTPVTPDLSPKTLQLLVKLMLAQGQACVYHIASSKDSVEDGLLAKLASGAAQLYDDSLKASKSTFFTFQNNNSSSLSTSTTTSKCVLPHEWKEEMEQRSLWWRAVSERHESIAALQQARGDAAGYAWEVARLRKSKAFLQHLLQQHNHTSTSSSSSASASSSHTRMHHEAEFLLNVVQQRLSEAEQDNAAMYREAIPKERDVGNVEQKILVKPAVLEDGMNPCSLKKPLFVGLTIHGS